MMLWFLPSFWSFIREYSISFFFWKSAAFLFKPFIYVIGHLQQCNQNAERDFNAASESHKICRNQSKKSAKRGREIKMLTGQLGNGTIGLPEFL